MTIEELILEIPTKSPMIILGDLVTAFYRAYKGPIKLLESREDVQNLLASLYGVRDLPYPLVLSGIDSISEQDRYLLLKFVEEATYPIVFLMFQDVRSDVLASRFMFVYKAYFNKLTIKFERAGNILDRYREIQDSSKSLVDMNIWIRDNSPELFYYNSIVKVPPPQRDKIISILTY